MIRAVDSDGVLIIGIPRKTLDRLLSGTYCATCDPQGPEDLQVTVRIYVGETDQDILKKMTADYGKEPEEVIDMRGRGSA